MAASGALLCLFLILHLAGNSTMFLGREAFNSYAGHLHSLGFFLVIFRAGLLLVLFLHVSVAILLFIENRQARPLRYHACPSSCGRTWGSRTMPYTGLAVLVFLVVHIINFQSRSVVLPSQAVRAVLGQPWYAAFYGVAVATLTLHLSHGCWSMWQTLGLIHPHWDRLLRRLALLFSVALGAIFMLIPLLALFYGKFLLS